MVSAIIGVLGVLSVCAIGLCVHKNSRYTEAHWQYLRNNKKSLKSSRDYKYDDYRYL